MFQKYRSLIITILIIQMIETPLVLAMTRTEIARCQHLFWNANDNDTETWGLKFLKDVRSSDRHALPTTLGIEVEGVFSYLYTRRDLAEGLRDFFLKKSALKDVSLTNELFEGSQVYFVTFLHRGHSYKYAVKEDSSVYAGENQKAVEINSPIIRYPEDLSLFLEALEMLRGRYSLSAEPSTGGVHIHVGFPEPKATEVAGLAQLFAAIEIEALEHFQTRASRSRYTQSTELFLVDYLNRTSSASVSLEGILENQVNRFYALNLRALKRYGTVEFRLFNSTVEADQLMYFINFTRGLVEAVRSQDLRLLEYLRDHQDAEQLSLYDLGRTLGLDIGSRELFESHQSEMRRLFPSLAEQNLETREAPRGSVIHFLQDYTVLILWGAVLGLTLTQWVGSEDETKK